MPLLCLALHWLRVPFVQHLALLPRSHRVCLSPARSLRLAPPRRRLVLVPQHPQTAQSLLMFTRHWVRIGAH
jgi:hypothetical protein